MPVHMHSAAPMMFLVWPKMSLVWPFTSLEPNFPSWGSSWNLHGSSSDCGVLEFQCFHLHRTSTDPSWIAVFFCGDECLCDVFAFTLLVRTLHGPFMDCGKLVFLKWLFRGLFLRILKTNTGPYCGLHPIVMWFESNKIDMDIYTVWWGLWRLRRGYGFSDGPMM